MVARQYLPDCIRKIYQNGHEQQQPQGTFFEKLDAGDFDIGYGSWTADYGDAGSALAIFHSNQINGLNSPRYNNQEFDTLLENAAQESDSNKRNDMYIKAETLAIKEDTILVSVMFANNETGYGVESCNPCYTSYYRRQLLPAREKNVIG